MTMHAKRLSSSILLIVALMGSPALFSGERPADADASGLRILVPPAPPSTIEAKKFTDYQRLSRCASLYLYERFAEIPEVEVVSEGWAASLLFEVQGGKRRSDPKRLLADLRSYLPLEAVISYAEDNGRFVFRFNGLNGLRTKSFPLKNTNSAKIIYVLGQFVAKELKLNDRAKKVLSDKRVPDKAVEACYLSRRLSTVWVYNSGEHRLELLRPFINDLIKYPYLAGMVMAAGKQMSIDRRKLKSAGRLLMMLKLAVPATLGTRYESETYDFLRVNRHSPQVFEKVILDMVRSLSRDEVENLADEDDEDIDDEFGGMEADAEENPIVALMTGRKTSAQLAGAVRCLGILKSKPALAFMPRFAGNEEPLVRRAAAFALRHYPAPAATKLLQRLAADKDLETALLAAYGLWKRKQPRKNLLALARKAFHKASVQQEAVEALADQGSKKDIPLLKKAVAVGAPQTRCLALRGILRLKALDLKSVAAWLNSSDEAVVATVAKNLPNTIDDRIRQRLITLANDPHIPVGESARDGLVKLRPPGEKERLRFDLATEHFYVRLKIVHRLAGAKEPWELVMLAEACNNPDPHIRAAAFDCLVQRDRDRATAKLSQMIGDPYVWVRVHAAAVARQLVDKSHAKMLEKAMAAETDPVVRLYLQDAIVKATGIALPGKKLPPVHRFDVKKTTYGLCGYADKAAESPIGYYYCLDIKMDDAGKAAHKAGKILICRSNTTAHNPVQVIFHPVWKDLWWLNMKQEFAAALNWVDGVVLGEESMYARPWQLWRDGWRLFCLDAGIAPDRVGGDRGKLSEYEKRAYLHWEEERAVDGFNRMYDFIKLYFGKLRPGFQVGTYMPDQNGPSVADRRWKFDVGGAYWYGANNRTRYNMIRRFKTLWPDRPVMWLVTGRVGIPFTGNDLLLKYNTKFSEHPVQGRTSKAYADSVAAWLAGADPGFFTAWLCAVKNMKGGPLASGSWLWVESVYDGSKSLDEAMKTMFKGVEEMYRFELKHGKEAKLDDGGLAEDDDDDDELELDEPDPEKDPARIRTKREMQRVRRGLFLEQKHLYDIARVFAGLPHLKHDHKILFVCARRGGIPQFDFASDYDVLFRINQLAAQDLDGYRFVGLAGQDKALLHDATIETVSRWLREKPGLLYIRGWAPTDNSMEASTPDDLDGKLTKDWPWEKEIRFDGRRYRASGRSAKTIREGLVFWKKTGFKGGVLFDNATKNAADLRQVINKLAAEHGIGLKSSGPVGMQIGAKGGIRGVASTYGALDTHTLEGLESLTGEADPRVSKGRSAAIVAKNYAGPYVASFNGISILCDRKIKSVNAVPGGLRISCAGLIRVASFTGTLSVEPESGRKLPKVAKKELLAWLLESDNPGVAAYEVGKSGKQKVYFIRSRGPVVLKSRK